MEKQKEGFWKVLYECSVCGEISKINSRLCPFCNSYLVNNRFDNSDILKADFSPTYYEFMDDIEKSPKEFRYL